MSDGPFRKILRKAFQSLSHLFFLFLSYCVRKYFDFKHGKGKQVSLVSNPILLQSANELALNIRTRKITSRKVVEAFIDRIKEVNPTLNCVVDNCYEKALTAADDVDELISSGKYSEDELLEEKPFLGVPISVKDNIACKGLLHSAGFWPRRECRAEKDSIVISLLKKAGAIPFALTNVPELCMWWETVNRIHGRTSNPYDTNRMVGGSSGGEGALQAAGGSPLGFGSDIGGSIRMPAFYNGVFGHKPSRNIVSLEGLFPETSAGEQSSFNVIGPLSRYAADLRPAMKVIAGDNAKLLKLDEPVDIEHIKYFFQFDDGGERFVSPVDEDQTEAIKKVVNHFNKVASSKVICSKLEDFKESCTIFFACMKGDKGIGWEEQCNENQGQMNPWSELVKWIIGISDHTFDTIFVTLLDLFEEPYGTSRHKQLVEKRNLLREEIKWLLGDNGVLIYPTNPTVALYHKETLVRPYNFSYTAIFNILGFPSTSVPLGLGTKENLPTGVQIVANINQDRLCLAVAEELEKAFGGWVSPGK
ncbi:FAAH2.2 family protein [Megaselia abdita]